MASNDRSIKNILEIESKAEALINRSRKKSLRIVESATKKKSAAIEDAQSSIEKAGQQKLAQASLKIEAKMQDLLKRSTFKRDALKEKAQKNMRKAVAYVIGLIEKE